ncbi:hypothetical protein DSLASN_10180 [Desulfoluna limicola]|uniref:Uncharacterized protein n=1 Tax=Desulfoluna limicola TaxID=2810562 RepID=A0ABN6F1D9_9BACT|nr:hypothetical protein DSLASN_10180 [Desulfoluna limicola]
MVLLLLGTHIEEDKVVVADKVCCLVHGDAVFAGNKEFDIHFPKDVRKGGGIKWGFWCHGYLRRQGFISYCEPINGSSTEAPG